MSISLGDLVRFKCYNGALPEVPLIFRSGHAMIVIECFPDGEYRCALADYDGEPVMENTDTVFIEELDLASPAADLN